MLILGIVYHMYVIYKGTDKRTIAEKIFLREPNARTGNEKFARILYQIVLYIGGTRLCVRCLFDDS